MGVYYVVMVDGNPRDTHAAESLRLALDLAMPDDGSDIKATVVTAEDAGAARLIGGELMAIGKAGWPMGKYPIT